MPGPDHKASLEPNELKEMVEAVRKVDLVLGSEIKRPNKSEKLMMKDVRKSIVATTDIKKGDVLTEKNLAIKRPGTGLSPSLWCEILGKAAKRDFKNGELIKI
jgi:N,N'-diacetyllegionaminate synthase